MLEVSVNCWTIFLLIIVRRTTADSDSTISLRDLTLCQFVSTDDCSQLVEQMVQCQNLIFNDEGFSYQQYRKNLQVHREMLGQHRLKCSGSPLFDALRPSADGKK